MLTSYLMIAESGGLTWTPETFYVAATVIHLVVILGVFRVLQLPADYNDFVGALFVAVPTNGLAYFTKDFGIVGVMITGLVFYGLLAAVSRGDVMKAAVVWVAGICAYWGLAYFVVPVMVAEHFEDPRQADTEFVAAQIGSIPQVLLQGGLEAEPMTADDYKRLRDSGKEE